jgi:hypothetical protein
MLVVYCPDASLLKAFDGHSIVNIIVLRIISYSVLHNLLWLAGGLYGSSARKCSRRNRLNPILVDTNTVNSRMFHRIQKSVQERAAKAREGR